MACTLPDFAGFLMAPRGIFVELKLYTFGMTGSEFCVGVDSAELERRRLGYYLSSANGDVVWEKSSINDVIVDSSLVWKWDTLIESPSNGRMVNAFLRRGK